MIDVLDVLNAAMCGFHYFTVSIIYFQSNMEENLIREIAKRPWMYDPKHNSYRDMYKKKNTWTEITLALGLQKTEGENNS